ncbi:TrbG/VirB9 family P-type conjugative transfer protein [Brevundimonas goettingensis]|uniref:TrbG/VirB9 family P-type conjugative transfer protein n=1 Tax=Brevundimonas goettingensis TaxID=2774190 RepID=UPI0021F0B9B8|nr:TrbG/VirB9 family P-type conjugative transfer protein [Brevundimonas goettingensis]
MRVTTLSLAPGETLVSKAAGDTVRWQIGEAASGSGEGRITHVLLKPLERGLETNLILTTNRRVYLIDLKSGGADAFNAAIAWDAGSVTGASSPVVAQSEGPEPPTPDRVRKSVVQTIVIAGAVLVSGSLAWAFVVQPELRANARDRQAEAREDQARGVVRPTDAVTDQPANYDRLPSPRGASPLDDAEAGPAAPPTSEARAPGYASSAHARSPMRPPNAPRARRAPAVRPRASWRRGRACSSPARRDRRQRRPFRRGVRARPSGRRARTWAPTLARSTTGTAWSRHFPRSSSRPVRLCLPPC